MLHGLRSLAEADLPATEQDARIAVGKRQSAAKKRHTLLHLPI